LYEDKFLAVFEIIIKTIMDANKTTVTLRPAQCQKEMKFLT
jgi:hypothetical protein